MRICSQLVRQPAQVVAVRSTNNRHQSSTQSSAKILYVPSIRPSRSSRMSLATAAGLKRPRARRARHLPMAYRRAKAGLGSVDNRPRQQAFHGFFQDPLALARRQTARGRGPKRERALPRRRPCSFCRCNSSCDRRENISARERACGLVPELTLAWTAKPGAKGPTRRSKGWPCGRTLSGAGSACGPLPPSRRHRPDFELRSVPLAPRFDGS